jgi:hypothetical protein
LTIAVTPNNADVCTWRLSAPERRCSRAIAGRATADVHGDSFVELSAQGYFAATVAAADIRADTTVELDPLPALYWPGWAQETAQATLMEWLPAKGATGDRWTNVARLDGRARVELPGETRAVRVRSTREGASPRTYFAVTPRSSISKPVPESIVAGGEIAVCIERLGKSVANYELILDGPTTGSNTIITAESGCVAAAGLAAARYVLRSKRDEFDALQTVVRAGESEWLGVIDLPTPANLVLRVVDGDPERRYAVAVTSTFAAPESSPGRKEFTSAADLSWIVRPGAYDVVVHPVDHPTIEMRESVSVKAGEEYLLLMQPTFVNVWGMAMQGGEPAPSTSLVFQRSDRGRVFSAPTSTGSDGAYEVILPQPGVWRVTVTREGQRNWRPPELEGTVPLVSRHEWNLELPGGSLRGRVVAARDGTPVPQIPVEARWRASGKESGFVTMTTDAQGEFEMSALPEGEISVVVSEAAARALGYRPAATQTFELPLPPERRIEFALAPAETNGSLLIRGANGESVPRAQAFLGGSENPPRLVGTADGAGRLDLPADLARPFALYVVATGYPWQRVVISEHVREDLPVTLAPPHGVLTQIIMGSDSSSTDPQVWGLLDEYGQQVPVFFHLLRQNASPLFKGRTVTIPLATPGHYRFWLRRAERTDDLVEPVILPSVPPVLLSPR